MGTLEEIYNGARRRVRMNHTQLWRAGYSPLQDIFEVQIDQGVADGHVVTFPQVSSGHAGAAGDICFVLQEKRLLRGTI